MGCNSATGLKVAAEANSSLCVGSPRRWAGLVNHCAEGGAKRCAVSSEAGFRGARFMASASQLGVCK